MRAKTFFLFSLAIIFGWFSLSASGALTSLSLNRTFKPALVVSDTNAIIGLTGFNDVTYNNVTNNYTNSNIGTIKNNSNRTLAVIVSINPNIISLRNNNSTWSMAFTLSQASTSQTLSFSGTGPQSVNPLSTTTINLPPGATIVLSVAITYSQNLFISTASYNISATGNGVSIQLSDTPNSRRRHNFSS